MNRLFIDLLQVALGNKCELSQVPTTSEWVWLYQEARKQAVVGILSVGLDHLSESQKPPKEILLNWIGQVYQIESRNKQLTESCSRLCESLEKDGFNVCILKGQANHSYYPEYVANRRMCGDIDVWVVPSPEEKKPVKAVMNYLERHYEMTGLCWLHTSINDKEGIPVEVHFRPSFMNEPLRNLRFQRHFRDIETCSCVKLIEGKNLPAMNIDKDVIYQMNHIYRHLIDEGVGLRQIIDYYYLLRSWNEHHTRSVEETMNTIRWLGMKRFAGALMYALREICGMTEDMLLCPASVDDGQFLISEIMLAGNFGHSDPRMTAVSGNQGHLCYQIGRAWRRAKRNMRFFTSYPGEVIWEPFARLWHVGWKKLVVW